MKEVRTWALLLVLASCALAMMPPSPPVPKQRHYAATGTTKGDGAKALIAPLAIVPPPRIKTNTLTFTFGLTNSMVQVYPGIYVAYVSYLHRVCTNYAELYGKQRMQDPWSFLSRTNQSPLRHSTTNAAMFYRVNSVWL